MKKFLFILVLFVSINVFALDYNVSSAIKYNVSLPGGSYGADDISDGYNSIMGRYNVGTRYNGRIGYMEFYLSCDSFDCSINHTYTITLNMSTNDWRNNFMGPQVLKCNSDGSIQSTNYSLSVSNFRFISRKQIKFNFKTNSTLSPYYKFVLYSSNYSSQGGTAITGDSNWNLSSIIISDNSSSSGGSSGGSSPTPTPSAGNQDIINNNNQNTNDIINNNNQNTTDIIDNANNNTQDIINNQNSLLGNKCLNLLDNSYNSRTIDNLTITKLDDNSIVLNGSSDPDVDTWLKLSDPITLSAGTYTLSNGNPNVSKLYAIFIDDNGNFNRNQNINIDTKTFNSSVVISPYIFIHHNSTFNNFVIKPMISPDENTTYCKYGSYLSKLDIVGQSVIDGANSIINNNNSNTNSIINNANDNTQNQIDSEKVCKTLDNSYFNTNGQLSSSGNLSNTSQSYGISDYLRLYSTSTLKVLSRPTSSSMARYCFYDNNKTFISCDSAFNKSIGDFITIPNNALYFRFTFVILGNYPNYELCTGGNQSLTDSITDSNIDSDVGSDFFDSFTNNMHGLSSIITIPLSSIQSLSSAQCSPLHIPIPFTSNKYLDIPCMTTIYEQYVPTLLTLLQTCWYGIISYKILIDIFYMVKGFKDPDSDKIEVLDL